MIAKVLVTIGVLAYGLLVPMLEINTTHVFNPAWVAHARLHEVWQLATNSSLAVFCLWLAWFKNDVRLPSLVTVFVTGSFLFAYAARGIYGGSMVHPDGSEKLIMGFNGGVVVFGLVVILSVATAVLDGRHRARS
ncbi:MAG: hypothetical protein ACRETN_03530 [Nevskiales bacterium]